MSLGFAALAGDDSAAKMLVDAAGPVRARIRNSAENDLKMQGLTGGNSSFNRLFLPENSGTQVKDVCAATIKLPSVDAFH